MWIVNGGGVTKKKTARFCLSGKKYVSAGIIYFSLYDCGNWTIAKHSEL